MPIVLLLRNLSGVLTQDILYSFSHIRMSGALYLLFLNLDSFQLISFAHMCVFI